MITNEDIINVYKSYVSWVDGPDRRLWEIRNPEFEQKKVNQTIMPDGIGEHNIKICYL